MVSFDARVRVAAALTVAVLLLAGCTGWSTPPTDVTDTTATLHGQALCAAETSDNPCTYWFQYWAEGSTTVLSTPRRDANLNTDGGFADVKQEITGLTPDTIYHAQLCGYGDRNVAQPGVCIGLHSSTLSAPGQRPDAGDFSATQRFRTAGPGTRATVEVGRPTSTADTRDTPISRDAGFSAAYSPTESLWIFGDTAQGPGGWFQLGTTAASGPYTRGLAPTALRELPTPPAAPTPDRTRPALFLPTPQGLRTTVIDDRGTVTEVACESADRSYPAAWTSGVARIPGTSTLLIVVHEVCVRTGLPTWPTERVKLMVYDPATNRFTAVVTPFAAAPLWSGVPAEHQLGSPVFGDDGFLYLYGSDIGSSRVFVARVPADRGAWGRDADYRWWNGADWTPVRASAVSVGAIASPWTAHVADYTGVGDHRLAMIVQDVFRDGGYTVYEATAPTGPWTATASGRVPDPCGPDFGCYAVTGHPELSTADSFMLSWYSPGDRAGRGHIRLGIIPWKALSGKY